MSDRITITWDTDDGYAGGSSPQKFSIDPEDYRNESKDSIEEMLWEEVQRDFENKVRPVCDVSEYADEILKALEANPEEEEE